VTPHPLSYASRPAQPVEQLCEWHGDQLVIQFPPPPKAAIVFRAGARLVFVGFLSVALIVGSFVGLRNLEALAWFLISAVICIVWMLLSLMALIKTARRLPMAATLVASPELLSISAPDERRAWETGLLRDARLCAWPSGAALVKVVVRVELGSGEIEEAEVHTSLATGWDEMETEMRRALRLGSHPSPTTISGKNARGC
jgi:hypothetical protein